MPNQLARYALGLAVAMMLGLHTARASDPLPGDAVAPPTDINIFLYYNQFSNAAALQPAHGDIYGRDTHISADVQVLRYIRTFNVAGMLSGVQIYEPYVSFIGSQVAGIENIPAPSFAPQGAPAFGPGRASLSHGGGFAQPQLGAFIFPCADAAAGRYFVAGVWLSPPVGGYRKNDYLNGDENLWAGEVEAGARTVLLGDAAGQNLSIELWGEGYFYGANDNAAIVSPAVSANEIPALYEFFGVTNPLRAASATPARLSEQPEGEFRLYLPYQFFPATRMAIVPGIYQSLGGKQVYTLRDGSKLDSGQRTEETQLRLAFYSYVSPHLQVILNGEYDLVARGGPLNRNIELRLAAAF